MKMHMISNLKDIILLLSSRVIPLNTLENCYLYKKIPKIMDDEFIVTFDIFNNEMSYINKISKGVYYFNKNISTEFRNLKILYINDINGNKVKNISSVYREIKDVNPRSIKKITSDDFNINYNNTPQILQDDIIMKFEKEQIVKFDKYKGLLYMFVAYFPDLIETILTNNVLYYNYFLKIQDIINDLRKNNLLDKNTYYSSLRFLNQLERNTLKEMNKLSEDNILFTISQDYKFLFQPEILELSYSEKKLFDYMLHFIVSKNEISIRDLIIYTSKTIQFDKELRTFVNDINIIMDRIINQNYLTDINQINSILLKNLYSFSINHTDPKDLYFYNKKTELKQSYLSYMLYGIYTGYSSITNALIFDDLIDSSSNMILLKPIKELENMCFDLKANMQYTRDRLFYVILLMLNNHIDFRLNSILIKESMRNNIRILEIQYNGDSIIIEYYPRSKYMARNIKYFDKRIRRLRDLTNNNILQSNNLVFSYYFKKDKKILPLNLVLEKKYMILLEHIYNASK